jgi:hypothetical protein
VPLSLALAHNVLCKMRENWCAWHLAPIFRMHVCRLRANSFARCFCWGQCHMHTRSHTEQKVGRPAWQEHLLVCGRVPLSVCDLISDESDQQVSMRIWKCPTRARDCCCGCCLFAPSMCQWLSARMCSSNKVVGRGCFDPSCGWKS